MLMGLLGRLEVLDYVVRVVSGLGRGEGRGDGIDGGSMSYGEDERRLVRAVVSRDYEEFRRVYRGMRPYDGEDRILEEYEWRVECDEGF